MTSEDLRLNAMVVDAVSESAKFISGDTDSERLQTAVTWHRQSANGAVTAAAAAAAAAGPAAVLVISDKEIIR